MKVNLRTDPETGASGILTMDKRERDLLAEDVALPLLLHTAMEAIIALRSGEPPAAPNAEADNWSEPSAGTSTETDNWSAMIHRTSQLIRVLEGALDGEIRAHAAVNGSYGQLAKALGVARSTAQTQRDALLAKAPSQWEPRPAEAAK